MQKPLASDSSFDVSKIYLTIYREKKKGFLCFNNSGFKNAVNAAKVVKKEVAVVTVATTVITDASEAAESAAIIASTLAAASAADENACSMAATYS
jgi:hypothetical protein